MLTNPFTLFDSTQVDVQMWSKQTPPEVLRGKRVLRLNQVHGNVVRTVDASSNDGLDGDGALTTDSNICLAVRWADCQNFVLHEPALGVVGVIHAGWQGIVAGVIPTWFKVLQEQFGADGTNVLVGSGPALCTNCAEFSDPHSELPTLDTTYFNGRHVNLRQIAYDQLTACGVQPNNVEVCNDCTKCLQNEYYSYRGDASVKANSELRNWLTVSLN